VERFKALPKDSPERQLNLLAMLERDSFSGETFLPDDVTDYFVETFTITGFRGGLNWYRNLGGAGAAMKGAKWEIDVPCLYVGAENDVILRPSSADGMEDHQGLRAAYRQGLRPLDAAGKARGVQPRCDRLVEAQVSLNSECVARVNFPRWTGQMKTCAYINGRRRHLRRIAAFVLVGILIGLFMNVAAASRAVAQVQSGRVVSDARYTAPYDAFMKMNRLQESFAKGQSAAEYWGVLESRLGNQAGRILIKRPAKDFDDDTFRGWLMFIRAYGDATGIGTARLTRARLPTMPGTTSARPNPVNTVAANLGGSRFPH
jgi:pimeloyl-ACP methyl ester carboxylesterase